MTTLRLAVLTMANAGLLLLGAQTCLAQEFNQSWISPKFTFCEGVGLNGTMWVYVTGNRKAGDNGSQVVQSLSVWAKSGFFAENPVSITAKASVTSPGEKGKEVILGRPTSTAFESQRDADESLHLYLNPKDTLTIRAGSKLTVTVTAITKTDSGYCVLGSTESSITSED